MAKEWSHDIPVEIRILVYRHLFSDHTVRMHASTCSCNSDCPFHTVPYQHRISAPAIFPSHREVFGPDLQAPRCVRAHTPARLHTNLFLTSKTIMNEAQQAFYHLTNFQTHPACIADLPRLFEQFTSYNATWKIGHLLDLHPHETGLSFCAISGWCHIESQLTTMQMSS